MRWRIDIGEGQWRKFLLCVQAAAASAKRRLRFLWQTALQNGLTTLNLTTPPVTAAEVYTTVTGKADWQNELPKPPFDYDLRSRHAALLGGADGYLCTKQQELDEICAFMRAWRN